MNADHRWQGYDHAELYRRIHSGPGPAASTASVARWVEVADALAEIDADLGRMITESGSGWEGAAGQRARGALSPLGRWAAEATTAATAMRARTEEQADNIGRARADMPAPLEVTAERPSAFMTGFTHLFGGQTDYEKQEAAARDAEQRAFEVMRGYEAATTETMSALGRFSRPPDVVVSTPPPVRDDGQAVSGFGPTFAPMERAASTARSQRSEGPADSHPVSESNPTRPPSPSPTGSATSVPSASVVVGSVEIPDERYAADYLISIDDVYGDGGRVAPAVFGEEPR